MKKIYLDFAATSPVKPEVLKAMRPYFSEKFGNPSSVHYFGRQAKFVVEESRRIISQFLNCLPEEIIFTSGGTESDNLAIKGLINALILSFSLSHSSHSISSLENISGSVNRHAENDKFSRKPNNKFIPHIITSSFEHHAVLHTCRDLEKMGLTEVTYINPDRDGLIHVEDVKKAIKPNTALVSIMYVNNEIGTVQPIAEIAKIIHKFKIYFHTDAVQAVEYQNCEIRKLGVDMLSLSAHKFGGPKGVGILYLKKATPIHHQNIGGAQEFKLRAGTENVAAIVGMGKAIEILSEKRKTKNEKLLKLRNYFIDKVIKNIPDVRLNGLQKFRSPNNVNFSFKYIEGESILIHLDLAGVAASTGSACTSGSLEPSHVLLSIGLSEIDAHGSIRFTLGEATTKAEIDYTIKNLERIVKNLRKISPFTKK